MCTIGIVITRVRTRTWRNHDGIRIQNGLAILIEFVEAVGQGLLDRVLKTAIETPSTRPPAPTMVRKFISH
jgi:hypothetical protein